MDHIFGFIQHDFIVVGFVLINISDQNVQSWSHANGRFPVYEAKVLFSQGRGRM